jgi:hypothetical protein
MGASEVSWQKGNRLSAPLLQQPQAAADRLSEPEVLPKEALYGAFDIVRLHARDARNDQHDQ